MRPVDHMVDETIAKLAVYKLLQWIGVDLNDDGLLDTPGRVARALREMTSGYDDDPEEILGTRFKADYDELVIVDDISFVSMCEHHLLPFVGTAAVAYLPGESVVGLSKIPRLVECFARRLQIQERLTQQIAQAMMEHVDPRGVAVVMKATHSCMSCRGVRQANSMMITSALLGELRDLPALRGELLALLR